MQYCKPCDRLFVTQRALEQHLENSSRHHICYICSYEPDFEDDDELNDHLEYIHHICISCDRGFSDSVKLRRHNIDVHNKCEACGTFFGSRSNLENHKKTHAKKTVPCSGCSKLFISDSAMVLHLESGYCESGADEDYVSRVAFECYQSRRYTSDDPDFGFECPACDTRFSFMSALLQHAESVDPCDEYLERDKALGKFLHYLRTRVWEL